MFISGGWDSKIRVWDIREKKSVRGFYGPHISGDSIDYKKG
jgi:COMPASS component SWD3